MAATDAASSLLNVSDFLIRFVAHPCLRRSQGQLGVYTDLQTALVAPVVRLVHGNDYLLGDIQLGVHIQAGMQQDRLHECVGIEVIEIGEISVGSVDHKRHVL